MFHLHQWPRRYAYAHACQRSVSRPYYESRQSRHGGFGIRRPLRYLTYHLDLDESQRRRMAASLESIKLEREQAKLNRKRTDAALADAFLSPDASVDELTRALATNATAESQMHSVIAKELFDIAAMLEPEQREEFAHLLRTGVLQL